MSIAHKSSNTEKLYTFLAFKLSGVVFIIIGNFKMPTVGGVVTFYERKQCHAQLS